MAYATFLWMKQKINFSKEQKKELIENARNAILNYIDGKKDIIKNELHQNPYFNLPKAVFVTLYKDKYLRGCIGTTSPQGTLFDSVKYYAIQAAFNDPRFSPVKKEEMKDIKLEISILSQPVEIKSYKEIREKKDGVIIITEGGSGLFLPQVWEHFKTKEEFLSELCEQKAGVKRDCFKDPRTKIYTFSVDVIEE